MIVSLNHRMLFGLNGFARFILPKRLLGSAKAWRFQQGVGAKPEG
jgi:hypothetical protein